MSFVPPMTVATSLPAIKTYAMFYADTGLFAERLITCEEGSAERMVGARYVCIADVAAPHAKKIVGGRLVEERGAQPSPDHEWNPELCEWRIKGSVVAAQKAVADAKAAIIELETGQARILRERDLGDMTLVEARQRLRAIDDQIIALRAIINT